MNITGIYDNEQQLRKGIELTTQRGAHIKDVLSPFPLNDENLATGRIFTSIPAIGLASGLLGAVLGMIFQIWVSVFAYPMQYGGKPFLSILSFIPIMFELAILFSAISMTTVFIIALKNRKRQVKSGFDQDGMDDHFVLKIEYEGAQNDDFQEFVRMLKETDTREIKVH